MARRPRFDLFPANVETPLEVHRLVRVLVTADDRVLVFGCPAGSTPALVEDAAVLDAVSTRPPLVVRTDRGDWKVMSAGGCGCGHPLKRMALDSLLGLAGPS